MPRVTVVWAWPERATIVELSVSDGTRIGAAVVEAARRSGLPDYGWAALGVHARRVSPDEVVRDGDRVEVYRALVADPKETRRRRSARPSGSRR